MTTDMVLRAMRSYYGKVPTKPSPAPGVLSTPEVDALLAADSPVAMGVSGGKDSCALAFELQHYLDRVGHRGPRLLIHSDLGRVEWKDSLPTCERLAQATGLELVVVRRQAGDLMDRWLTRWTNNVTRYQDLSCVRLILPWSTPSMRFCTSEMKTDVICRDLCKRYPGGGILSASGIRRDESDKRKNSPISKPQEKLTSKTHSTFGIDWHPILGYSKRDIFALLKTRGFLLHEAYRVFNSSRVSCAFCIMSSFDDMVAASGCLENQDLYREMVGLEARSSFAFQGSRWLGDIAPHLLNNALTVKLEWAKGAAEEREKAEAKIPPHLLYTKGWPTCLPTRDEARMLAGVRRLVSKVVMIPGMKCLDEESVMARYQELLAAKAAKEAGS